MEDFTRELTPGNTKAAMKAVGASSSDLWKVEPARLRVLEGFNARIKNDAYTARVRWIADSIKANGFYPDKPLTGFVALEDGEEVIYITGGHRRHEEDLRTSRRQAVRRLTDSNGLRRGPPRAGFFLLT